jgi:Ca2+-binding EF-hand superfamily protein
LISAFSILIASSAIAQDRQGREGRRGRGGFDYKNYLNGLDKNQNGYIDPDELTSGRTKSWIGGLGFDTNRRIRVRDVIGKVESQARDRQRSSQRKEAEKNFTNEIPGFFDFEIETEPVIGFGLQYANTGEETGSSNSSTKQYSASVIEQVEQTLRQYDRNKNGILDADEIRRARWGSPSPSDSDLNKDGRLSKTELSERYKRRETSNRSSSSSSNRSSSWRNRNPSTSSARSSTRSSGGSSRTTSSGSSSSSNDGYGAYVAGVIKRYDADKDGKLSKDEIKKMSRPPKNADANKDGFLTNEELLTHYSGGKSASAGSGSSRAPTRSRSSSGSRSSRSPVSFRNNDADGDGQIAMHEFSKEWDDKTLDEFNKLDLNKNGFITQEEMDISRNSTSTSSKTGSSSSDSRRSRDRLRRNN